MKKIISLLTLAVLFFNSVSAQDYNSLGGTIGIINLKARVQYEHGLSNRSTVGTQLTYYFVNWTGPKLEVFGRLYSKKNGIEEGFFIQGKLGYGNLSVLDEDIFYTETKRWSTMGFGLAPGWKFMFSDKLGIETLLGLHFYSSPNYPINGYDDFYEELGEDVGWFITTGLPIDFQLKLIYRL